MPPLSNVLQKNPHRPGVTGRLRAYFLAGILVTAPFALTAYLVWLVVDFVDSRVMPLFPERYNPNAYLPVGIPGIGLIVAFVLLTAIGALTAGLAGRFLVGFGETILARMPVVRGVYGAIKQIVSTIVSKQSTSFREVVLIEYPRKAMWSIGFITGNPTRDIQALSESYDMVGVFVPTTPNPTSGYLVFVDRREILPLAMTVEEGIKLVVSCGIVTPEIAAPPVGSAGREDAGRRAADNA